MSFHCPVNLSNRLRLDDDTLLGLAKCEAYNSVADIVVGEMKTEDLIAQVNKELDLIDKSLKGLSAADAGESDAGESGIDDGGVTTNATSSDDFDVLTRCKQSLMAALKRASKSAGVALMPDRCPWGTLPAYLTSISHVITGWPASCPMPHEVKRKMNNGMKNLGTKNARVLLHSFENGDLKIVKSDQGDIKASKVPIISTGKPFTTDDSDVCERSYYANGRTVMAPKPLKGSAQTRIKRKPKEVLIVSGSESEKDEPSSPPKIVKIRSKNPAPPPSVSGQTHSTSSRSKRPVVVVTSSEDELLTPLPSEISEVPTAAQPPAAATLPPAPPSPGVQTKRSTADPSNAAPSNTTLRPRPKRRFAVSPSDPAEPNNAALNAPPNAAAAIKRGNIEPPAEQEKTALHGKRRRISPPEPSTDTAGTVNNEGDDQDEHVSAKTPRRTRSTTTKRGRGRASPAKPSTRPSKKTTKHAVTAAEPPAPKIPTEPSQPTANPRLSQSLTTSDLHASQVGHQPQTGQDAVDGFLRPGVAEQRPAVTPAPRSELPEGEVLNAHNHFYNHPYGDSYEGPYDRANAFSRGSFHPSYNGNPTTTYHPFPSWRDASARGPPQGFPTSHMYPPYPPPVRGGHRSHPGSYYSPYGPPPTRASASEPGPSQTGPSTTEGHQHWLGYFDEGQHWGTGVPPADKEEGAAEPGMN
ncbi:hypothetical protein H0H92_010261 [Tricholoma furcatifolium]|nr:hypothetical protein H0H92_010261 [Tricholoma furcatifolium]